MRPNFLVIGAMKSGTTSLWQYLNSHPDIFLCYPKEPGFFVEELTWNRGWEWYESLFDNSHGATALGDASTHYAKFPTYQGVAERIAEHLPSVKLIYIMRDPVARTVSHYWHMHHYWHETRPMIRAFKEDPQYIAFSRYAYQLEQYLPFFSRDQILLLSFEQLKREPNVVMRQCYEFLGVDSTFTPSELGRVHNEGPREVRRTQKLLHQIRWSPWWAKLAHAVPRPLKEWGKKLEFTRIERPRATPPQVLDYLRSQFAEENERVFEIAGRRFEEWNNSPAPALTEIATA